MLTITVSEMISEGGKFVGYEPLKVREVDFKKKDGDDQVIHVVVEREAP